MKRKVKFFYFAPHPVQYHTGLYREIANLKNIEFRVIYEDDIGVKPVYIGDFKKEIKWDIDLLEGYSYEFMRNYSFNSTGGFFSRINFGIFRKILIEKPDIIMFQGYTNFSDWLIMLLSRLSGIKIIFRGEATLRGNESTGFRSKLKSIFLRWWLKNCNIVMYSCSGNKRYWQYYGVESKKMFPVPCAVDNDFFRNERKKYFKKREEIRKKLKIEKDDFVIISISRMNKNKNLSSLIEAVNIIDNKNIVLLFVGDGPEREKCEKLCKSYGINSRFVGFKNVSEISQYYVISDLFILLSKDFENSPKVLNEAMNFELPVIVTNIAGTVEDLVFNEKNGYSVDPLDIEEISQKIDYLNKNRKIGKDMGKKSLEIVKEWNFKKDAFYIEKIYNRILKDEILKWGLG